MDPLTQGLLGAAAAQIALQKRLGGRAWLYGAIGGMAADLDVLIRDPVDPLVGWTYHRHFTHSLSFIPIGGLLSSLPWVFRKKFAEQRKLIIAATTVGYATHALLDAFTSYGTLLWWPFSDTRVAWNAVGIIDPIFTVALAVGVAVTAWKDRLPPVLVACGFCAAYLGLGFVQRARARTELEQLAAVRGHVPTRLEATPLPLSNVLWRGLYTTDGEIHAAGIHLPWFGVASSRYGGSTRLVDAPLPGWDHDARLVEAFETFRWFADGWVAAEGDTRLVDIRFSTTLSDPTGMWGMDVHPDEDPPVTAFAPRRADADLGEFFDTLTGGFPPDG